MQEQDSNNALCVVKNEDDDWEEWDPSKISFVNHMIAGSFAGLAEHVSIFPIDTVKTHIQCEKCGSTSPFQTWMCAEKIVKGEGLFRLWRGVSSMFAGCIPAHAIYFSVYEQAKVVLGADKSGHHPFHAAMCGALAALSHDLIMTPFDTVKQRMQLGYSKNILHCFNSVITKEGVRALYISLPTTLVMNIPYGCVMVSINESLRKILSSDEKNQAITNLVAGAVAGGIAALVTNPLDVVKTRLQIQNLEPYHMQPMGICPRSSYSSHLPHESSIVVERPSLSSGSMPYTSAKQVLRQTLKEQGFLGLMRGSFPRVLVHSPSVAISWTAYEFVKGLLLRLSDSSEKKLSL